MLRRRVGWVLAQIAAREDGDLRAARQAAHAQIDPLLRGWVRGRVDRAVAEAMFETTRTDDEQHVHRLAMLRTLGEPFGLPDDVDGVATAFERNRPRRAPQKHGFTLAASGALVVLLLGAGTGAWWLTRPPAPLHDSMPASAGAWDHGGRPMPGEPPVEAVFERAVPDFVVALDAYRAARGTPREAGTRAEVENAAGEASRASTAALGAETTSFLRAVLDQSLDIVENDGDSAADSHLRSVEALNAAIAGRGIGYYVDAEVRTEIPSGRHRVYLSTFTVERVRFFEAEGQRLRALRLRRLDRLGFARAVLGFTRPQVQDGLVLLGRIEGYLVDTILPALGPDATMPLFDDRSRERLGSSAGWVERVETAAGYDAREEAEAIFGERALALGALFARRRQILDGWRERLGGDGWSVARPTTVDFDVDAYAALEPRVPADEWRSLRNVASELTDEAHRETYRALEERFVASVERHEVQHRLDYATGALETLPAPLERVSGPLERNGRPSYRARRALAELSAYLSELARGPDIVKTNLALFAGHLFDQRRWGTAECDAALVVFEQLAPLLDLGTHSLLVGRGIDRRSLATVYLALRARPSAEVASAAAALWRALFGRPLSPLTPADER